MTTRQANDIASNDENKHSGVLMTWLWAVIADQDRVYSAISWQINTFLYRTVLAR